MQKVQDLGVTKFVSVSKYFCYGMIYWLNNGTVLVGILSRIVDWSYLMLRHVATGDMI
jgi:hypothetical protein